MGYYDHDDNIQTYENIDSAVHCQEKCQQHSSCDGFVYREGFSVEENLKRCEVKSQLKSDKFKHYHGFIHGRKTCGKKVKLHHGMNKYVLFEHSLQVEQVAQQPTHLLM